MSDLVMTWGMVYDIDIAMENGPFIVGLPNLKLVIFHGHVK